MRSDRHLEPSCGSGLTMRSGSRVEPHHHPPSGGYFSYRYPGMVSDTLLPTPNLRKSTQRANARRQAFKGRRVCGVFSPAVRPLRKNHSTQNYITLKYFMLNSGAPEAPLTPRFRGVLKCHPAHPGLGPQAKYHNVLFLKYAAGIRTHVWPSCWNGHPC